VICDKLQISETASGCLIAIASTIPEFTANMISVFHQNQEMLDFGFGTIIGSGIYGK